MSNKLPSMIPYISEINRPKKENCLHGDPIVSSGNGGINTHEGEGAKGKNNKVEGLVFDTQFPNFNQLIEKN